MEIINRKQYVDRVLNYLGKGLILVLTGQRRVGKSCILQSVAKQITAKDDSANVIYMDLRMPCAIFKPRICVIL